MSTAAPYGAGETTSPVSREVPAEYSESVLIDHRRISCLCGQLMAYKFNGTYRAVNTSVDGSHVKLMFASIHHPFITVDLAEQRTPATKYVIDQPSRSDNLNLSIILGYIVTFMSTVESRTSGGGHARGESTCGSGVLSGVQEHSS